MTQAQYKALMARRQQLLNKTSDISGNENLLLNKQERRVTFENDTQKAIIEPNTAEVIENNVSQNIQKILSHLRQYLIMLFKILPKFKNRRNNK